MTANVLSHEGYGNKQALNYKSLRNILEEQLQWEDQM